jgi:hypothetical protein
MLTILALYLVILFTMVYGPIAAFLVELFPARTRYSSDGGSGYRRRGEPRLHSRADA